LKQTFAAPSRSWNFGLEAAVGCNMHKCQLGLRPSIFIEHMSEDELV
jgi:hypothetical protein